MRYTLREGVKRKSSPLPVVVSLVLFMTGMYLLYNTFSPNLPNFSINSQSVAQKLTTTQPVVQENRIYMPQINVDVPIVDVKVHETEERALDKGAIHRVPANGNPKDGGNYVVAAHRFTLGITPSQTRAKSPFYHIDQVKVGDQLYIDFDGVRYAYKVFKKEFVAETKVSIEERTEKPQLTVYSCGLSGSHDGREVIFASMIGTVAWGDDGKANIKPIETS